MEQLRVLHAFALDPRSGDWSAVAARAKRLEEAGLTGRMATAGPHPNS